MKRDWQRRSTWFSAVKKEDLRKVLARIRKHGALTIRDIDDDVLVEKNHRVGEPQAVEAGAAAGLLPGRGDRQPADRHAEDLRADEPALRMGAPAEARVGEGDPGLPARPRATIAGHREPGFGLLSRPPAQAGHAAVDRDQSAPQRAGRRSSSRGPASWSTGRGPRRSIATFDPAEEMVHILSPFDPLINQRKRLQLFFGYEHRFEAYVPKEKRLIRLLCTARARRRRDRRRHRSQDRSREASCGCRNGPGSAIAPAGRTSGGSRKRCIDSSVSNWHAERYYVGPTAVGECALRSRLRTTSARTLGCALIWRQPCPPASSA